MKLHQYLQDAASKRPGNIAVRESTGSQVSYRDLALLSDRVRDWLLASGVKPGDRVGFWIPKSIDGVAVLFGALKAGAAYVPVDPGAPAARNGYIMANCAVAAAVVEKGFVEGLKTEITRNGGTVPPILEIGGHGGGTHLRAALDAAGMRAGNDVEVAAADLAYILYTSGSTGRPKGVMLTHRNATAFVEWCSELLTPDEKDRFSSHAPFHFDLSVLDIFTCIKHGATLVLIGEDDGKNPGELAQIIAAQRISVWYSAPSILALLAQYGKLPSRDYSALRAVIFAGEVFAIKHLKALAQHWSHPRYYNLYGPTETNVCTSYEVPLPIPEECNEPMPIGKVCSHLEGVVIDAGGRAVPRGTEGELVIRGPNVTQGYWNLPEQTGRAFITVGAPPAYYRTGDVVIELPDGNLKYLGRRDRMIKKRGFRVELGEIESCLYGYPGIAEAAVVALPDESLGMKVCAHLACKEGGKLSLIELKKFCAERIPLYMVPDAFSFHRALPKTSTDKVDYQTLLAQSRS